MGAHRQGYHPMEPNNKRKEETNMGIKINDFLKLSGDKGESVMLYECDTEKAITVAVKDLFDIFKLSHTDIYNVKAEYVDIMEAEIASWEYDDGIIVKHSTVSKWQMGTSRQWLIISTTVI